MIIVDADTHTSNENGARAEELIESMNRAGVDKSLVWVKPPYNKKFDEVNDYVYKSTKKYPDRLIGFGWVDPQIGKDAAKKRVKKYLNDYGFSGLKLNGAQNNFCIDDPKMSIPLIEEVAKNGKILAFHCGANSYELTHPYRAGNVAKIFPELPILLIHMGGVSFPDLSKTAIEIAMKHKNIYLVGSHISPVSILNAINKVGADRVCFGSDTPFELMHVEIAKYKALMEDIDAKDRDLIMGGNIQRLLRI